MSEKSKKSVTEKILNTLVPVLALGVSLVSIYYSNFRTSNKARVVIDSSASNPLGHSYHSSFFIINSGNTDLLINSIGIIVPSVSKRSNPIENPCSGGEVAIEGKNTPIIIKPGEIIPIKLNGEYELDCYWRLIKEVSVASDTLDLMFEEAMSPEQLEDVITCKKIDLSLSISGAFGSGKVFDKQIVLNKLYYQFENNTPFRLHETMFPRGTHFDL